jgi:two-component system alkaline phosphatase synthesis response regulator PhoP
MEISGISGAAAVLLPSDQEPGQASATIVQPGIETSVTIGDLQVDIERELVFVGTERIHLTGTEFRILRTLLMRSSAVIRREILLATVRSHTESISSRSLDRHISRLRMKLGKHGSWIRTFKGVGYRFFPNLPL